MTPSTRMTLHLAVIGVALTMAAVRPAEATGVAPHGPREHVAQHVVVHHTARHVARHHVVRRHTAPHAVGHRTVRHVVRHHATHVAPSRVTRVASTPTGWSLLDAAIARIPTYHPHAARWVVSGRYGHWGTTDWYHDTLYIAPTVPSGYVYDVAVHEWSHELSVLDYNGDVPAATSAMNRWFGGSGLVGAERAADCMAILQGAHWTHYTSCTDRRWRSAAAKLLHGRRL